LNGARLKRSLECRRREEKLYLLLRAYAWWGARAGDPLRPGLSIFESWEASDARCYRAFLSKRHL